MKAILLLFDTLNRHMSPAHGCEWIRVPNYERLAPRTMTFEIACIGSRPRMSALRDLHTRRYNFMHRIRLYASSSQRGKRAPHLEHPDPYSSTEPYLRG